MKSIKKKAEEYENGFDTCHFGSRDIIKSYEAGANYVLEQLEEFLNLYGIYSINSSAKAYLKDMIEQLKSNQ